MAEYDMKQQKIDSRAIANNVKGKQHSLGIEPYQFKWPLAKDKLNVIGEFHPLSEAFREEEKQYCQVETNSGNYWTESQFRKSQTEFNKDSAFDMTPFADPFLLRCDFDLSIIKTLINELGTSLGGEEQEGNSWLLFYSDLNSVITELLNRCLDFNDVKDGFEIAEDDIFYNNVNGTIYKPLESAFDLCTQIDEVKQNLVLHFEKLKSYCDAMIRERGELASTDELSKLRSDRMQAAAELQKGTCGVWKVGDEHAEDMEKDPNSGFSITRVSEFYSNFKQWLSVNHGDRFEEFEEKERLVNFILQKKRELSGDS